MGSDLHTGDSIFRPPRTYWDGKELVIEKWNDYHFSYKEFYRGPLSEKVNGILMGLGVRIPPSRKKIKKSLEKLEGQVEELKAQSAAGFRREGYLRGHVLKDGQPRDVVLLGILAAEWAELREEARRALSDANLIAA